MKKLVKHKVLVVLMIIACGLLLFFYAKNRMPRHPEESNIVSYVLLVLSFVGSIIALWYENWAKGVPVNESPKDKKIRIKTRRAKRWSTVILIISSLFAGYQVHLSDISDKKKIIDEKNKYKEELAHYKELGKVSDIVKTIQVKADSIVGTLDNISNGTKLLEGYSQRILFPLDSNISMSFSFGFKSQQTREKISEYYKVNLDDGTYISYNFPYIENIRALFENLTISVIFYRPNINFSTDKEEFIMSLQNKALLKGFERNYGKQDGPLPGIELFQMSYDTLKNIFNFGCDYVPLVINNRIDKYSSILDYENSKVTVNLYVKNDKGDHFLDNWDSTFVNFQLNFSNKKHSKAYTLSHTRSQSDFDLKRLEFQE